MKNTNTVFKLKAGVGDMFTIIDSHPVFKYSPAKYTLQSVYWENAFDGNILPGEDSVAYSTIQGRKGKENVGLLKNRFYWPCTAILLDNLTPQQIVDLALVVMDSPKVDADNKRAVKRKLEKYYSSKTNAQGEKRIHFCLAELVYGLFYACYFNLEEALMDKPKKKPQLGEDGVIRVVSDAPPVDAESVVKHTMQGLSLPWDTLAENIEVQPLKVVHFFIILRGGLFEAMDKDYARFFIEKRSWMSKGRYIKGEDDEKDTHVKAHKVLDELFMDGNSWTSFKKFVAAPILVKNFNMEDVMLDGGHQTRIHTMTDSVSSGEFVVTSTPAFNTNGTMTTGEMDKNAIVALVDIPGGGLSLQVSINNTDYFEIDNFLKFEGKILHSKTGAIYYCGDRARANVNPKKHDFSRPLNLQKIDFLTWISHLVVKFMYGKLTSELKKGNMAYVSGQIGRLVRSEIQKLPNLKADNYKLACFFLDNFIWIDTDDTGTLRDHMWVTLEKLGYDLRLTSHAVRGDKLGLNTNGTNVLLDLLPFGQVANRNRISKAVSTMQNHIPVDHAVIEFTGKINPHTIETGCMTQLVVAYIHSDIFGADGGAEPCDETLRTIYGTQKLTSTRSFWKVATREEFDKTKLEYQETLVKQNNLLIEVQSFIDRSIAAGTVPHKASYKKLETVKATVASIEAILVGMDARSKSINISGSFWEDVFMVPDHTSSTSKEYKKLVFNGRGGSVNTHRDLRLVAFFQPVNDTNSVMLAGEWESIPHREIDILDSEKALAKKNPANIVLEMATSNVDNKERLNNFNEMTAEELIHPDRSDAAFRASKNARESVAVGEFTDYVSTLEEVLISEGKRSDGHLFVYEVLEDGSLSPVLDTKGNLYHCMVGSVTTMQAAYDGESGSYNIISKDKVNLDFNVRALSGEFNEITTEMMEEYKLHQSNIYQLQLFDAKVSKKKSMYGSEYRTHYNP
jgi:hypothetical protein